MDDVISEMEDPGLASLPRDELVARARALQTVIRVAHAVMDARKLTELAERFAQAVAAHTRFPSVVVWRFSPELQAFEILAQHGFSESIPRKNLGLKTSFTGLAAERGEILTTDDVCNDPRVDPEIRVALAANAYTSGASVPVLHEGKLLGAFNLIYPRGTALDPNERRLFGTLAKALGYAIAQLSAAERERALEAQALRAQQLESLGVLAGGIAHDFNNLLTGIVGSVDLARTLAEEVGKQELTDLLGQALGAASRAGLLVRQLMTFSSGAQPNRRLVNDLGRVIGEVVSFATRGTSVRCEVEIAEPLGAVDVDVGQISQVLQNLVLNACQASKRGGSVLVRARRRAEPDRGSGIVVEIIDAGTGIAPEHIARIFEPFFTTRLGGTGLGLAVSRSIVQRHGGRLDVRSELGRGTTFTLWLPGSERPMPEEEAPAASSTRFSGRALVMDDEPDVRRIAQVLLASLGFEVDTVEDGAAALDAAARAVAEHRPFRVALLDLTIVGGLGAADIAPDFRRVSPTTSMIVSSGYAPEGFVDEHELFLQKPYTLDELSAALAQALEAAQASPAPASNA